MIKNIGIILSGISLLLLYYYYAYSIIVIFILRHAYIN